MKKLFVILTIAFTLTTLVANAQFSLSTAIGYGMKINSHYDYSLYQTAVTLDPQYTIDKVTIYTEGLSVISDSSTKLFSGLKVDYAFWNIKSEANKKLSANVHALLGEAGTKLFGGGINYTVDNVYVGFDASQEYLNKELWLNLSVGYFLLNNNDKFYK